MPENAGSRMGPRGNFLQVGSTDAAGMDPEQKFARANVGNGHRFHTDIVLAAVDSSLHGGGDFRQPAFDRDLSGNRHHDVWSSFARTSLCGSVLVNLTSTVMWSR